MTLRDDFAHDDHGARFSDVQAQDGPALAAVLALLDQPLSRQRMEDAELVHDRPALAGVVGSIEALPEVAALRGSRPDAQTHRFRQAAGVAVKLAMRRWGWRTTGRKGSLAGMSDWFTRAERYSRPEPDHLEDGPPDGGSPRYASLEEMFDAMDVIGAAEEQQADYESLMAALARTRAEEGRAF